MKKKMLIVSFLAAVMLMVPFTAIAGVSSFIAPISLSESREVTSEEEIPTSIELTEEELRQLYAFLENPENLEIPLVVKQAIQNALTPMDDGGAILDLKVLKNELPTGRGQYVFIPCDYIDIQGEGRVTPEPTDVVYWELTIGQVNINDFSRECKENELTAGGWFSGFTGDVTEDPMEISGVASRGFLWEISYLVDVTLDEGEYKQGETVIAVTTNIGENNIEIEKPCFKIYREDGNRFLPRNFVYSECLDDVVLESDESFTWSWDQKDKNGKQVLPDMYTIVGEFPINEITHVHSIGLYIKRKGKSDESTDSQRMLLNSPQSFMSESNFIQNFFGRLIGIRNIQASTRTMPIFSTLIRQLLRR